MNDIQMRTLNPPLRVNNVEIHFINQPDQQLNLVIHIPTGSDELSTPKIQNWVFNQIKLAYSYLELEGFISNVENGNWQHHTTAILHPPQTQL
jgi:hypothetical protein